MKTKNFIISFVLMLSLLVTAFAFTPSTVDALEVSVKVEEVAITLPAPLLAQPFIATMRQLQLNII